MFSSAFVLLAGLCWFYFCIYSVYIIHTLLLFNNVAFNLFFKLVSPCMSLSYLHVYVVLGELSSHHVLLCFQQLPLCSWTPFITRTWSHPPGSIRTPGDEWPPCVWRSVKRCEATLLRWPRCSSAVNVKTTQGSYTSSSPPLTFHHSHPAQIFQTGQKKRQFDIYNSFH